MKKFLAFFVLSFLFFFVVAQSANQKIARTAIDRGRKVYETHCLSCHMANGEGVPRMNPSLVRSKYVTGSKTRLIRIVLRGSKELENEPDRFFTNPMAPMNHLNDQQIAEVLSFIRNNFGNKASAVTAGDVRYVRVRTRQ